MLALLLWRQLSERSWERNHLTINHSQRVEDWYVMKGKIITEWSHIKGSRLYPILEGTGKVFTQFVRGWKCTM